MTRSVVRKSRSRRKVSEGPEIRRGSSTALVAVRGRLPDIAGGRRVSRDSAPYAKREREMNGGDDDDDDEDEDEDVDNNNNSCCSNSYSYFGVLAPTPFFTHRESESSRPPSITTKSPSPRPTTIARRTALYAAAALTGFPSGSLLHFCNPNGVRPSAPGFTGPPVCARLMRKKPWLADRRLNPVRRTISLRLICLAPDHNRAPS